MFPRDNDSDRFDLGLDDDPGFRPEGDPRLHTGWRPNRLWLMLPLVLIAALMSEVTPWGTARSVEAPAAADPAASVVPFRMLPSNHMVVDVKLNGEGPYRLIFDLGSPVTILSNRAAEGSGAVPRNAPKSFLFGTRGEGKVETLEVGDLTAEDVPIVIMDHPALKALGGLLGRPLDGIVGYTFFARYKTTIDYQNNEMTFTPVEFEVRDLLADLPQRMMGPKVAKTRVLAPEGLWGLTLGAPEGGVDHPGVTITAVAPGSPADKAGLQPGDILTTLDGRWTTSMADTFAAAADAAPGTAIPAVILRDDEEITLTITPVPGI